MSTRIRQIISQAVSSIGHGAMGIGGRAYGAVDSDEERFKGLLKLHHRASVILDKLYEIGCRIWDTASLYVRLATALHTGLKTHYAIRGDSEDLIGKWFTRTGKRSEIFLATKFGFTPNQQIRGDPEFFKEQIAISLSKLQTDYVDLYYQHHPDHKVPIEVTANAMAELVKQGKVNYLGLSDASPETIRRAHAVHPISAIQVEYSPFELTVEKPGGVIDTARELSISIIAYFLTGCRLTIADDFPEGDGRRAYPKFAAKNFPHILKLVEALEAVGKNHGGATAAQVTIAWLLAQGEDIIPIPGSKQEKYVVKNFEAGKITLREEEVKTIREAAERIYKDLSADERYPAAYAHMSFVDTPSLEEWKKTH